MRRFEALNSNDRWKSSLDANSHVFHWMPPGLRGVPFALVGPGDARCTAGELTRIATCFRGDRRASFGGDAGFGDSRGLICCQLPNPTSRVQHLLIVTHLIVLLDSLSLCFLGHVLRTCFLYRILVVCL